MNDTQPYERVQRSWKQLLLNNFLGGLAWGVGSVLGATVLVVSLGYLIATTRQLPLIGEVIDVVVDQIETRLDQSEYFDLPEQVN